MSTDDPTKPPRPEPNSGAEWVVLLHSRSATPDDLRCLHAWREVSTANDLDFRRAETVWLMTRELAHEFGLKPPLSRLAKTFEFFVTRRHYKNVIATQIADIQEEYKDAKAQGRVWMARWIVIRGCASLVHKPLWLWMLALITRAVDAISRTQ